MSVLTLKAGIMEIAPYAPGKDGRRQGDDRQAVVQRGRAGAVALKAMAAYAKAAAELHRYPDGGAEKLRAAIGRHDGDAKRIVCGAGSTSC